MQLLSYVASLDRGIAAFPKQQREADRLSAAVEATFDRAVSLVSGSAVAMSLLEGIGSDGL